MFCCVPEDMFWCTYFFVFCYDPPYCDMFWSACSAMFCHVQPCSAMFQTTCSTMFWITCFAMFCNARKACSRTYACHVLPYSATFQNIFVDHISPDIRLTKCHHPGWCNIFRAFYGIFYCIFGFQVFVSNLVLLKNTPFLG